MLLYLWYISFNPEIGNNVIGRYLGKYCSFFRRFKKNPCNVGRSLATIIGVKLFVVCPKIEYVCIPYFNQQKKKTFLCVGNESLDDDCYQ